MESTALQAAKLLNQMAKDMPGPTVFIFRYVEKLELCLFCDRSCSVFWWIPFQYPYPSSDALPVHGVHVADQDKKNCKQQVAHRK